jgi:hypothetical protein
MHALAMKTEAPEAVAAMQMAGAEKDCIRALAAKLDGKEPAGVFHTDGSGAGWVPLPCHLNDGLKDAWRVVEAVQADQKDSSGFRAKKYCKSWTHRWWLAEAFMRGVPNLPPYVYEAAERLDFGRIRERRADVAVDAIAKAELARAKAEAKAEAKTAAAQPAAKAQARLDKAEASLARLAKSLARVEKVKKGILTRIKKAERAKRAAQKVLGQK